MSAKIINQAGTNKPLTQVCYHLISRDRRIGDAIAIGLLQLVQGGGRQFDQGPRCRVGSEDPRQLCLPRLRYVAPFAQCTPRVPLMRLFLLLLSVDTDQTRHMHKDILKHQEENIPLRRFAQVGVVRPA